MRRKIISLTILLALSLTAFAQTATPPTQPDTGPGGKQYVHAKVTKNRYGTGNQEYWIFEPDTPKPATRSEEHTSELQSQSNLVCRLLLEKKKKDDITK